ncbi:MAG: LysM peptidoglycan-binding domain-containing protein [Salinivirgaceae bacterium]|nr:LysM peptidoglycan-binding domain-containing protein [Salinivirgaceae bacterium]
MNYIKYTATGLLMFTIGLSLASGAKVDSLNISKSQYENEIDSLVNLWYNKQLSPGNDTSFVVAEITDLLYIPDFSDSVYRERLDALPVVLDMSYNKIVRNYIHMYAHKRRDLVETMLGLSDYYFPIFEQILDANNMPLELKYLPVIESALNPNAVSRAGATGIWQFMYYTGKMYKLEINSFVDERRDPIKASYAAVAFLQDLYDIYEDWILVIAAYNCGPGNVNKAIRRSGGKKNYWDIYYHLPRETRGYVPAFIAATYVMNYHNEHNLTSKKSELPIMCDTIITSERIHLEQISKVMGISLAELRSLNPQYRRDIVPGKGVKYAIRFPFEETTRFIDMHDSIIGFNDSIYFNPETLSKTPIYNSYKPGAPTKNHVKLTYGIKSGDNLGFIAEWYQVSVSNLKFWNNIRNSRIRSGQKLTIYVHKSKVSKYEKIDQMSFAEKQASIGKQVKTTSVKPVELLQNGEYEMYTVKRGDTLWDIAKLFPGVTDTEIMGWNGINDASKISVGQKLKIKITG